ncbi:hypothetical protein NADFUDRAFT_40775 [Nadsonia fulvescens var. elongata DSM 6958]|uniref:DUF8032 domain-containing protein n=1 Tax=Nadsonia fulvescens var. elongata DSM 6958 TaxID=857566 RepID=A0A1E3PQB9_9ASCO|nr:hypothetical protein NADFUDRAFT_40775 [Nadsonia fulvescens var. elongata DSM 6958]
MITYNTKNILTVTHEIGDFCVDSGTLFDLMEENTDYMDPMGNEEYIEDKVDPHHYYFMKKAGSSDIHQKKAAHHSIGSGSSSPVLSLSEYINNNFTSDYENVFNQLPSNSSNGLSNKLFDVSSNTFDSRPTSRVNNNSLLSSPFPLYPVQFNHDIYNSTPTTPNFRNYPDYDELSSISSISTDSYFSPTPSNQKRGVYLRDNQDLTIKDTTGKKTISNICPIANSNDYRDHVDFFGSAISSKQPMILGDLADNGKTRNEGYFVENFDVSYTDDGIDLDQCFNDASRSPRTKFLPSSSYDSHLSNSTGDVPLSASILQKFFTPNSPCNFPFEPQPMLNFQIKSPEREAETNNTIDDYNGYDVYRPFAARPLEQPEISPIHLNNAFSDKREAKSSKMYPVILRIRKSDSSGNSGSIQKPLLGTRRKSLTISPPNSQSSFKPIGNNESKRRHSFSGRRRGSIGSVDLAHINRAISETPKNDLAKKLAQQKPASLLKKKSGPLPASKGRTTIFKSSSLDGFPYFNTEYTIDGVLMEFSLRCDIINADFTRLTSSTVEEWSIYPNALSVIKDSRGGRSKYEHQVNIIGLALILLNPSIQEVTLKRATQFATGLVQRCVDCFRNSDDSLMSRRTKKMISDRQQLQKTKSSLKAHEKRRANENAIIKRDKGLNQSNTGSPPIYQDLNSEYEHDIYSSEYSSSSAIIAAGSIGSEPQWNLPVIFKYNDLYDKEKEDDDFRPFLGENAGNTGADEDVAIEFEPSDNEDGEDVYLVEAPIPADRLPSAFNQLNRLISRYQPLLDTLSEKQIKRRPRNRPFSL